MDTPDKVREIWSRKIDSYDSYLAAVTECRVLGIGPVSANGVVLPLLRLDAASTVIGSRDSWPLLREMSRERYGVYPPPTPVLLATRSAVGMAGQHFPHISPDDPTMVAYTPDRAMGIADRQVRTTPGKLLRKFFPYMSDNDVSTFEKAHRAALDDNFEVATTGDEIERIYRTMRGDTGCMRYSAAHFGLTVHPSRVYEAPGMGVAYLQDDGGTPTARTVIWVNPDNDQDKRYVRLYGDPLLETKLKRKGFRLAGLAGAKIKAIPQPELGTNYYAVPYLDAPGGSTGNTNCIAGGLIKFVDEDFIRILDKNQVSVVRPHGASIGGSYGGGSHASLNLPATERGLLTATCMITGKTIDRTSQSAMRWMQPDGSIGWALNAELPPYKGCRAVVNDTLTAVYCSEDTYTNLVVSFCGVKNDAESLLLAGYVKLSPRFYSAEGEEGYATTGAVENLGTAQAPEWINRSDAIRILDHREGELEYRHVDESKQLRKDGYVAVSPLGGVKCMVHRDSPKLVHLVGSGRASVIGHHDIRKLFDGTWAPTRRTAARHICGITVTYHEEVHAGITQITRQVAEETVAKFPAGTTAERLRQMSVQYASNGVNGSCPYYVAEGRIAEHGSHTWSQSVLTYHSLKDAATQIHENREDSDWLDNNISSYGHVKESAVGWAASVLLIFEAFDRRIDEINAPAPATSASEERFAMAA